MGFGGRPNYATARPASWHLHRDDRPWPAAVVTVRGSTSSKSPNIVFILAYDLGYHECCLCTPNFQYPPACRTASVRTRSAFLARLFQSAVCSAKAYTALITGQLQYATARPGRAL